MRVELVQVTPDMAFDYLSTNDHNRRLDVRRVKHLAAAMRSGEWQLNGETIILSSDGVLLDGQHRLAALREYGRPLTMLVARGVESSAFKTIDTGVARSATQVLGMAGINNAVACASAAKMLWQMHHNVGMLITPPPTYILQVVERYPQIEGWARRTVGRGVSLVLPATALVVACVYLDTIANKPDEAETFFRGVTEGVGLLEGSPILALRNRIINLRSSGTRLDSMTVWPVTVRAISYFEDGRSISKIRADTSRSGPVSRPDLWSRHVRNMSPQQRLIDLLPPEYAKGD